MDSRGDGSSSGSGLGLHGHRPRKRLGQNFLRDRSFLPRIIEAAEIGADDDVVEIGAGNGVLTRALLQAAHCVCAVELDDALFELLRDGLGDNPGLRLVHGDALDFEPQTVFTGPYKLTGNIPYYLTGMLIRKFLEAKHGPQVVVFMVQREVADRIVAPPGRLSLLGVSVQYYAHASVEARVPAGAFFPVPKVDSAILKLVPYRHPAGSESEAFFRLVRAGFSMPRKQLANSLSAGLDFDRGALSTVLAEAGIDGKRRAETLSVTEWLALTAAIESTGRGA